MDRQTHERVSNLLAAAAADRGPRGQQAYAEARRLMSLYRHTGGASREAFDVGHSVINTDQIHPPNPSDFIIPLIAPSRYLVVPNIEAVAPQTISTGSRLEFSAGGGWLIGWRGIARDDTAGVEAAGPYEQATMGVRMFINDGEELITNGLGADFVTFAELFPESAQWAPILRRVDTKDILNLFFQNFQPLATGNDLTPRLTFSFWREKYPGTG